MRQLFRIGLAFNLTVTAGLFAATAFFACGTMLAGYGLLAAFSSVLALRGASPALIPSLRFWLLRLAVRARRGVARGLAAGSRFAVGALPMARRHALPVVSLLFVFALGTDVFAGAMGPWETAANALCTAFTGVIGKGLALVAFTVGGLMFAFGEGGSKSALAGLIFGAGMVLMAPQFLNWVLPGSNAVC